MSWLSGIAFAFVAWLIISRRDTVWPEPAWPEPVDSAIDFPSSFPSHEEYDGGWMPDADQLQDTVADQLPTPIESFIVTAQAAVQSIPEVLGFAPPMIDQPVTDRNQRAFLDMIAYAEGTGGPNGYRRASR